VEPRDACLFPKLPSSSGIIEHKNQYNLYPLIPSKYRPGTCQVSWENNNLSIPENGMSVQVGFSTREILRSGIVPPNTLRKILEVFTVHKIHPQQLFYYMFSLKLHWGEPAPVLVPSPFWVRPVSDHIKLKKCLIWTQRP
jgi:hypothetical protein